MLIDGYQLRRNHLEFINPIHTLHSVISMNGSWFGTLHVMTENEKGIDFVDTNQNHSLIQNPFIIREWIPFEYGLIVSDEDDFNMLYSLTLTQKVVPDPIQSNSRICVFLIAAQRAAYPKIVPVSFNGNTTCLWRSIDGVGENFWVM